MKGRFLLGTSLAVIAGGVGLVYMSSRSSLYSLKTIEVVGLPVHAPLNAQTVSELTAVTPGKGSLLALDLDKIEKKVLAHPWIRGVRLEKKLPETLVVSVEFRKPRAILQKPDGAMSYVDDQGAIFGPVGAATERDLPLLLGFKAPRTLEATQQLREAVEFTERWEKAESGKISQLSALSWDADKGYRASLVYKMKDPKRLGRATLEVGQLSLAQDDSTWRVIDANVGKVLRYLSTQSISVHQIFVGDGKKIVVKTARGS